MSGITPTRSAPACSATTRRVRHDVRDGLLVMAFSLGASSVLALLLTSLVHVGS
ncbi:MAG: hypothetical protein ACR2FG_02835 [Marmoricola sp.]